MSGLSDILEKCLREVQNPTKAAPPKPVKKLASGLPSRSLYFQEGSSDKEYHIRIVEVVRLLATPPLYHVEFQYGRRGNKLVSGTKTVHPTNFQDAQEIYSKVLQEKIGKGYQ